MKTNYCSKLDRLKKKINNQKDDLVDNGSIERYEDENV